MLKVEDSHPDVDNDNTTATNYSAKRRSYKGFEFGVEVKAFVSERVDKSEVGLAYMVGNQNWRRRLKILRDKDGQVIWYFGNGSQYKEMKFRGSFPVKLNMKFDGKTMRYYVDDVVLASEVMNIPSQDEYVLVGVTQYDPDKPNVSASFDNFRLVWVK